MSEHDEFDRAASWTVDAIEHLGPDHAEPGACRGSGGPGALAWLSTWLLDAAPGPFLDQGGGLGGPGAWLAAQHQVRPVVAEPMHGAASGARRLFRLDSLQADGAALPFPDDTFGAAWCLGVLSTTAAPHVVLSETARVLRPAGRFGLVVYLSAEDQPVDEPDGNHFPTHTELDRVLDRAGFEVVSTVALDDLAPADTGWNARADAVDREVERRHGDDVAWQRARTGEDQVARLLETGRVTGIAVRASR